MLILHNSNSSRPRHCPPWRRHGPSLPLVLPPPCPPSSIPGVCMGLAPRETPQALWQWSPVSGLWVMVMVMGQGNTLQPPGPLCLPGSEPVLTQLVFSDGWVLGAQRKGLSTGSLDPCRGPQPAQGQAPRRGEGQPGPASEMRFFTSTNFFLLSPLTSVFVDVFIFLPVHNQHAHLFFFFYFRMSQKWPRTSWSFSTPGFMATVSLSRGVLYTSVSQCFSWPNLHLHLALCLPAVKMLLRWEDAAWMGETFPR